jgi:hypothetical protein
MGRRLIGGDVALRGATVFFPAFMVVAERLVGSGAMVGA